jgi:hypothetical protein
MIKVCAVYRAHHAALDGYAYGLMIAALLITTSP